MSRYCDCNREGHSSGIFKGLILGGLVGAGIALLFAPQSGEETRKVLKKKGKYLQKEAENFLEDTFENWEENKEEIAKKVKDLSKRVEKNVDRVSSFLQEEHPWSETVEDTKEALGESRKALDDIWSRRFSKEVETEPQKVRSVDSDEVELARKVLSRASGRSFYRKTPRRVE